MAQLLAVVANGGKKVTPRIVKEIQNQQGQTVEVIEPAEPVEAIQPETATLLREYLTGVIESGTGWRAASTIVSTAGKTGTSQYQGVWFPAWRQQTNRNG